MTLVLSIQPYEFDALNNDPLMYGTITVDLDSSTNVTLPRPIVESQLKRLLADGLVNVGMRVSACLWLEQCDDEMGDTSEIVTWFDMAVANLHDENSVWW